MPSKKMSPFALAVPAALAGAVLAATVSLVGLSAHRGDDLREIPSAARPLPAVKRAVDRDERNELLAAMRREQTGLREDVQDALDELDAQLAKKSGRDKKAVDEMRARRAALEADLHALETTPDAEWDALKARIEKRLTERSG